MKFGDAQLSWLRQCRTFEYGIPRQHCQAETLARIVALGGQLKGNQPQLAHWVEQAFTEAREQPRSDYHESFD